MAQHAGRDPGGNTRSGCGFRKPGSHGGGRERVEVLVEEKMRMGEPEGAAHVEEGACQTGDPVVCQEDLSFVAALAGESDCPADEVDVSAAEADHLVDANACRHHQGDG